MGVSFSEDRITFRGDLTTDEIKQIVRNGGVDTLQTDNFLQAVLKRTKRLKKWLISTIRNVRQMLI